MLFIKFIFVFVIQFHLIVNKEEPEPEDPVESIGSSVSDETLSSENNAENSSEHSRVEVTVKGESTKLLAYKPSGIDLGSDSRPSICYGLPIDCAVRMSATLTYVFIFKDQFYWLLDLTTAVVSEPKKISDDFNAKIELKNIDACFIHKGFNQKQPNEGQLMLLKKDLIWRFVVKFLNNTNYKIEFMDFKAVTVLWKINNFADKFRAVTQLGTFDEKKQIVENFQDILVLHGDNYTVLKALDDNYQQFRYNIEAKSEANSNRLSNFDPKTRTDSYWKSMASVPLKDVMDVNAFVYFPNGELLAIGKEDYCQIIIDSMTSVTAPDLVCHKKSVKELFGCKEKDNSEETITQLQPNPNVETETETESSVSDRKTTSLPSGGAEEGTDSGEKSSYFIYYIIGGIFVLFILLAIIMFFALLAAQKKGKKDSHLPQTKSQLDKSKSNEDKIDPKFGQIDSQLNLHLRIANPSLASINTGSAVAAKPTFAPASKSTSPSSAQPNANKVVPKTDTNKKA